MELNELHDTNLISTKILDHLKWLKDSGMLVNESKTEIMILHRTERIKKVINIGDTSIESKNKMRVLGVIFNQNLTWQDHIINTINSCQRVLHGLKVIRKYFDIKKFTQILTCFLFSKLFYAFEVWSYNILSYDCKRMLDSFYYKACRVIINDFKCEISRDIIDLQIKRATPKEYSDYCLARTVIMSHNCKNSFLKEICKQNSYTISRKPGQIFFFDNSRLKLEKQSISNRINEVFKAINFPWQNLKFEILRPKLKQIFFK